MKDLTPLFCSVDDFCKEFEPQWGSKLLEAGVICRKRKRSLSLSEVMTILIAFHQVRFRDFKHFYLFLLQFCRKDFPGLPSYSRFIQWVPSVLVPLCAYLESRKGDCTGIQFIDSTAVSVCKNKRIQRNKVFKGLAQLGKNTMGYFYGFKLHLIVNDLGELLSFKVTPGNFDDRSVLLGLTAGLQGKLFGDKGYISAKKFKELFQAGLKLITPIRSNMKNRILPLEEKLLLRKRSIVETINDQLKNISQIEHTRHRSQWNFMVNLVCGLIAYTHQPKKPSISLKNVFPLSA